MSVETEFEMNRTRIFAMLFDYDYKVEKMPPDVRRRYEDLLQRNARLRAQFHAVVN